MLTQEKYDQGLDDNCQDEQADADIPQEIAIPLYDFLHKTPVWSLSKTLKEELQKYRRNVIQPASAPLLILLHERRPSYEERVKKLLEEDMQNFLTAVEPGNNNLEEDVVKRSNTEIYRGRPYLKLFHQLDADVKEQMKFGNNTAAENNNQTMTGAPAPAREVAPVLLQKIWKFFDVQVTEK